MLPALRLGFIVAPDWAMPILVAAKNWPGLALRHAYSERNSRVHCRRSFGATCQKDGVIYKQRRESLLKCLEEDLGEWLHQSVTLRPAHCCHCKLLGESRTGDGGVATLQYDNSYVEPIFLGAGNVEGLDIRLRYVDVPAIRRGVSLLREALQG